MSKTTKVILIIGAVLIVISVIGMIAAKEPSPVMYIKDGETYLSTSDGTYQITNDLYDVNGIDKGFGKITVHASTLGHMAGKYLYYADNMKAGGLWDIYCRDITDLDSEPIYIDTGIMFYQVSEDGMVVTYMKPDIIHYDVIGNTKLYQRNIEENESVLIDGVHSYYMSPETSIVYYQDRDFNVCKYEDGMKTILSSVGRHFEICYNNSGAFYEVGSNGQYSIRYHNGESEFDLGVQTSGYISMRYATDDTVYYVCDGELYYVQFNEGKVQYSGNINDNVTYKRSATAPSVYFTENDDMYIESLFVASNVKQSREQFEPHVGVKIYRDSVYYCTEDTLDVLTLYVYKAGKTIKIDEDIYDFALLSDGRIAYIKDHDGESGTMYIYDGKESVKFADDVEGVIHTTMRNVSKSFGF